MGFLPGQGDFVPALRLAAGHHPNGFALRLEDGALLDMAFEEGADLAPAACRVARIADSFQGLAEGNPVSVGLGLGLGFVEHAREHARAGHGR